MPTADPTASPDAGRDREAGAALPCPFCGRRPTINRVRDGNCQLHGEKLYKHVVSCSDHAIMSHPHSRQEAVDAWNRRATPPARAAAGDDAPTFGPKLEAAWRADREAQAEAHEPASDDPGTMSGIERLDAAAEAGWALRRAILAEKMDAYAEGYARAKSLYADRDAVPDDDAP